MLFHRIAGSCRAGPLSLRTVSTMLESRERDWGAGDLCDSGSSTTWSDSPEATSPLSTKSRLQLLRLADEAGFHGYHLAQHHHSPLCLAPNQSVFLAAVAQRTERLRFGPLVYVLPLHHPIRLIEEIGMVDQLSDGRYFVGVGKGTGGGTERAMWGEDPADADALYDETLEVMLAGFRTSSSPIRASSTTSMTSGSRFVRSSSLTRPSGTPGTQ